MLYYIIIALQVYCIYHAYKNKSSYYWFFIIFFIPLLGCIVYLLTQVVNKKDVTNITDEITTIINPTKKIKDLEKEFTFSNTFQNKINLADGYKQLKEYEKAILYYEKSLIGNFVSDPHTINKLIQCYFKVDDFDKVIVYAKKIDLDKNFKTSLYYYGLSLEQKGDFKAAEHQLKKMDTRFSNYEERMELANFLIRRDKNENAKEILEEIQVEIKSMTDTNKKKYRFVHQESQKVLNQL
ncbi:MULTISPECIES: hypothetical protein [unclassified Polaribacter]|uniref:hypothetical protein n=1 Tax=unclassified Polaribacter TaxID=196858 RepID=UPI0011BEC36A|nr:MULTISPECIES: hypothetical protein [unclassified Polaribacter]TXD53324.1 hypothetical protein ES043_04750 [Polaribacter sp. IC063]TXD57169.1 hypothetical protein ES044_15700 [Polaribacter sp. IC066]